MTAVPWKGPLGVGLVHALLAALAAGALALWGSGADPGKRDGEVTLPDPDPRTPVAASGLSIVRPPGTVVLDTTEKERGAPVAKVLPEREVDVFSRHGIAVVRAIVTRDGGLSQGVWQFPVPDRADPQQAASAIDKLYAAGGWEPLAGQPAEVLVRKQSPKAGRALTAYRAHYVTGRHLIRVEAYGPDAAAADRAFAELLGSQLSKWPATQRASQ